MPRKRWKDPTFDPDAPQVWPPWQETDFPQHNPPGWRFPWAIVAIAFGMLMVFLFLVWTVVVWGW